MLKDGDVIALGEHSVLRVSITAASAAAPPAAGAAAASRAPLAVAHTVESFLNAQCEGAIAQLQVRNAARARALALHSCACEPGV